MACFGEWDAKNAVELWNPCTIGLKISANFLGGNMPKTRNRTVMNWLFVFAFVVAFLVVFGGSFA
jgi:hypothetical protein